MVEHSGFSVRHNVPGRLRVHIPQVRFSPERCRRLEVRLHKLAGVTRASVRPATGSAVLYYEPSTTTLNEIIAELQGKPLFPFSGDECRADLQPCAEGRELRTYLINALALSGFLLYALIRQWIIKSPLQQGRLSITGLAATAGALPMFGRAWHDLRPRKTPGLFRFLATACVVAVAAGAAFTAFEIVWVLSIGVLLEAYAAERTRRAVKDLVQVRPPTAYILTDGVEVEIPVDDLAVGNIVVVRTGEQIPVDGEVAAGEALVDEAHITGRTQPELRSLQDKVYAGTFVQQGRLHVGAEKVGEETYLSRILELVQQSLSTRADAERKADLLAARLTRLGLAATFGTLFLTRSLSRSLTVMLVMSCPCAAVLAASTAVTSAIANAARRKILIKGGLYLERISLVDAVCFDKTGTLTRETLRVEQIVTRAPGQNPNRVLERAAAAEGNNQHPVARTLVEEAHRRELDGIEGLETEVYLGRGVCARQNGEIVLVGNQRFLAEHGVSTNYFKRKADRAMSAGRTIVYVARNGKLQGMIVLTNVVRPEAKAVVDWLYQDGIKRQSLISGDVEPAVRSLAEETGFTELQADLLPEQKAHYVHRFNQSGCGVLVVGDGVNDAPALAQAFVGVALGAGGSRAAVETADVALAGDDLSGLVVLRQLSRQTLKVIDQNFWMATFTNALGIAAGATGWFTPMVAGLLHVGHTLTIMLNSSRLLGWKK